MKHLFVLISICILFITGETTFAQTATDYYLPLSIGSYVHLYTAGNLPWWGARTTTYSIEGTDTIAGKVHFREVGRDNDIFHVFWLRADSVGNVVWGAASNSSTNIDSAQKMYYKYFPNEFLTNGYSRKLVQGKKTSQDSVLSITETVIVPAGTFHNCLKVSETRFDSTGTAEYREIHYYAYGVGMVRNERTIPDSEAHVDNLTAYGTTGVIGGEVNQTPRGFSLYQNYPNPFNPSTTISFSLPLKAFVSLRVFNILGREITTIVSEEMSAGSYSRKWNAANLSSGIYFYRLQAGSFTETKELVLLK